MPTDIITDQLNIDRLNVDLVCIQLVANLNFNFPQVVQQHTLGVVGYITWVLFAIYSSFEQ